MSPGRDALTAAGTDGSARSENEPEPIWLSWSSGKDSAFTFERLRNDRRYRVVALLTTVTEAFGRVSMHGVREELLDRQARALRLPLVKARIPYPCPNDRYEATMRELLEQARHEGVRRVAFGDLFLEDVRRYREERLSAVGMEPLFPLWGMPTGELAGTILDVGVRATVCTLDPRTMPPALVGRPYDRAFLDALPAGVDPCGERGEFHTFVSQSPSFAEPVRVVPGEVVERDGFLFADLLPA